MADGEQAEQAQILREIPVEWEIPDSPAPYATNLVVQHTEHEFRISFFQVEQPILLGEEEERDRQAEAVEMVPARCVARVIVSATKMEDFVNVLQENFGRYKNTYERRQTS